MTEQIAQRIGRTLERCGLIERDMENAWLANFTEATHDFLVIDYQNMFGAHELLL